VTVHIGTGMLITSQINSAWPSIVGMRNMRCTLRVEGLMWLTGAVVCLHAALRVKLFANAENGQLQYQ